MLVWESVSSEGGAEVRHGWRDIKVGGEWAEQEKASFHNNELARTIGGIKK